MVLRCKKSYFHTLAWNPRHWDCFHSLWSPWAFQLRATFDYPGVSWSLHFVASKPAKINGWTGYIWITWHLHSGMIQKKWLIREKMTLPSSNWPTKLLSRIHRSAIHGMIQSSPWDLVRPRDSPNPIATLSRPKHHTKPGWTPGGTLEMTGKVRAIAGIKTS